MWYNKLSFYLINSSALDSQLVLVHRNDLLVDQDSFVLGPDGSQVNRHEEWSGEDSPHGHLGLALLVTQTEVTNDQLQ